MLVDSFHFFSDEEFEHRKKIIWIASLHDSGVRWLGLWEIKSHFNHFAIFGRAGGYHNVNK
jgi:hypothetical protein